MSSIRLSFFVPRPGACLEMGRLSLFAVLLVAAALQAAGVHAQTCASATDSSMCTTYGADTTNNPDGCYWSVDQCYAVPSGTPTCESSTGQDTCFAVSNLNEPSLPTGCKWDYSSQTCSIDSCSSLSSTCGDYPNSCAVAIDGTCVNKPTCSSAANEETCGGLFGDACAWREGQCVEWSTCEHNFITSVHLRRFARS